MLKDPIKSTRKSLDLINIRKLQDTKSILKKKNQISNIFSDKEVEKNIPFKLTPKNLFMNLSTQRRESLYKENVKALNREVIEDTVC